MWPKVKENDRPIQNLTFVIAILRLSDQKHTNTKKNYLPFLPAGTRQQVNLATRNCREHHFVFKFDKRFHKKKD